MCAATVASVFLYTQETNGELLLNLLNQTLQLGLVILKTNSIYDIMKKLAVYGNTVGGFFACTMLMLGPLVVDFCPLQLVFGTGLIVKLCGIVLYGPLIMHGFPVIFSLVLLEIMFLELVTEYSHRLYGTLGRNKLRAFSFRKYVTMFQVMRMVITLHRLVCETLFVSLLIVGIFMISCAGYATISLYYELPLFVYLIAPILTVAGFIVAIVFTHMASTPFENVKRSNISWGLVLYTRKDRLTLRSMPQVGFTLGPYGLVTRKLGLLICEDIVENVVNLLML